VQSTSVSNLVVPNDGNWNEYYVQDVCTSPAIYEARCSVSCAWSYNIATQQTAATMIDDARFRNGSHSARALIPDWAYYNGNGNQPGLESVPQTNVGSFFQLSYAKTNVTFYVLANDPDQAVYYPNETALWQMRTSWQDPGQGGAWTTLWVNMTLVGSLTIPLSLLTVIAGHSLICVPFAITVLMSRFEGFDKSLEEASLDLGENGWMTFWRVTFPLALPGIISSLLLTFIVSFDEFLIAYFLAGNEATLPIYIWGQLRFPYKLPTVLALGALILVASTVLVILAEWMRSRGLGDRKHMMVGA
jgi:hypothetical protein